MTTTFKERLHTANGFSVTFELDEDAMLKRGWVPNTGRSKELVALESACWKATGLGWEACQTPLELPEAIAGIAQQLKNSEFELENLQARVDAAEKVAEERRWRAKAAELELETLRSVVNASEDAKVVFAAAKEWKNSYSFQDVCELEPDNKLWLTIESLPPTHYPPEQKDYVELLDKWYRDERAAGRVLDLKIFWGDGNTSLQYRAKALYETVTGKRHMVPLDFASLDGTDKSASRASVFLDGHKLDVDMSKFCLTCGNSGQVGSGVMVGGVRRPNQIGGGVRELKKPCPKCSAEKSPADARADRRARFETK